MATCSSILAWTIPWTEVHGDSPWGRKKLDMMSTHTCRLEGQHNLMKHVDLKAGMI